MAVLHGVGKRKSRFFWEKARYIVTPGRLAEHRHQDDRQKTAPHALVADGLFTDAGLFLLILEGERDKRDFSVFASTWGFVWLSCRGEFKTACRTGGCRSGRLCCLPQWPARNPRSSPWKDGGGSSLFFDPVRPGAGAGGRNAIAAGFPRPSPPPSSA